MGQQMYSRVESDKMSLCSIFVNKSDDMESTAVGRHRTSVCGIIKLSSGVFSFKASREFNAMNIRFTVPDGKQGN